MDLVARTLRLAQARVKLLTDHLMEGVPGMAGRNITDGEDPSWLLATSLQTFGATPPFAFAPDLLHRWQKPTV